GRRRHRGDSADQTTYRKPDQRSVSVVVRKGAKDSAVAHKEAGQAAQDHAADKSHRHGENKIGPLAFHGHQGQFTLDGRQRSKSVPYFWASQATGQAKGGRDHPRTQGNPPFLVLATPG